MDFPKAQAEAAPSTPTGNGESSWWSVKRQPSARKTGSRTSWLLNSAKKAFGGRPESGEAEGESDFGVRRLTEITIDTTEPAKAFNPICPWESDGPPMPLSINSVMSPQAGNTRPGTAVSVRTRSDSASLKMGDPACPWDDSPRSARTTDQNRNWSGPGKHQPISPPTTRPSSEVMSAGPLSRRSTSELPTPPTTSASDLPSPPPSAILPFHRYSNAFQYPPPSGPPPTIPLPRPPSLASDFSNDSDGSHYLEEPNYQEMQLTRQPIVIEDEVMYDEEDRLLIREEGWGEYLKEYDAGSDDDEPYYTYDEGYRLIDQMYEEDFADDVEEELSEEEWQRMLTTGDLDSVLKAFFPDEMLLGGEQTKSNRAPIDILLTFIKSFHLKPLLKKLTTTPTGLVPKTVANGQSIKDANRESTIAAAREVLGYPHNDHRRFDDYESAQKWMRETGDTHSPSLGHGHGGSLRSSDFAGGYSKTSSGPSQGIQSGSYSEDSPRTGYAAAQYDYGYDSTYENAGAHDGAGDYEDGGQYDDAGDYEAGEHYDEEGGYQDGGDYGDYGDDGGYEDGGCYDDDGGYDDYSGGGDYGDDEY
ncbi:hypothetical protein Dda_1619 [Drechslerella dactyloides]|uniref:Uncharacterized protein n=1 Tax=Drechslerella dactyloides TaxID=74499 RepID=A0AAD6J2C2_DREDA|nr:hypothetical protein Dda_1619 [Drechslerella dactyloides]